MFYCQLVNEITKILFVQNLLVQKKNRKLTWGNFILKK